MIKKTLLTTAMTFAVMIFATLTSNAEEVKAANLTSVRYQDPDSTTESLIQINRHGEDNNLFQEHSPNGPFNFKVVSKDEWTVYLYDESREMSMMINLHEKKITWGRGPNKGQPTQIIGHYPIHSFQ